MKTESKHMLFAERAHTDDVLSDLTKLLRQMSIVRAPRSLIPLSGGLTFEPAMEGGLANIGSIKRFQTSVRIK